MFTYTQLKEDLYRLCGATSTTARTDVITAVAQSINRAQAKFALRGDWSFLEQYQDRVDIALEAPYTTGTVDVVQDSKSVVGTTTAWTKDFEGRYFRLKGQEFYEIRSFTSAGAITLDIPYQHDSASTQDYEIYRRFYNLPLNFMRPHGLEAKLVQPGSGNSEMVLYYSRNASFADKMQTNRPKWFGIVGNRRRADYFNTGTVTVATTSGTSTWTISTGTLPTDIVDREVRIAGETNSYFINARTGATTFTTYDAYVNPSDETGAISAASYAITPKDTMLVGFSQIPDQRYIFSMPYIKRLPDLVSGADVSPISLAGYDDAFMAMCRSVLAQDFRTLLASGVDRQGLSNEGELAMADAWLNEQHGDMMANQGSGNRNDRRQLPASWIG